MTRRSASYSADAIELLKDMAPVKRRGFTIASHAGMQLLEKNIEACSALLRTDDTLWFVRLTSKSGKSMLVFRGPNPGQV